MALSEREKEQLDKRLRASMSNGGSLSIFPVMEKGKLRIWKDFEMKVVYYCDGIRIEDAYKVQKLSSFDKEKDELLKDGWKYFE